MFWKSVFHILLCREHLFSEFFWYSDSEAFLVYWMNRISNIAVPQLCERSGNDWLCSVTEVTNLCIFCSRAATIFVMLLWGATVLIRHG